MTQYAHKGQILPLTNQMIPIDKQTTFHASYDYHLNGYNQGDLVYPLGTTKATAFDGSTGAIDIMPISSITNKFTIEFWINPPDTTSAKHIAGQASSFGVVKNATGIKFVIWANDWQTSYIPAANTWTHVAAVYDGTNRYIYFNGVLQGSIATTGNVPASSYRFCIGRWDTLSSSENYPNSTLYDVRLWSIARSQSDIQNNMYKSLIGSESGLLGNWKLSETEGSVYFDSSINANSGTKVGTLTPVRGPIVATVQKNQGKFGGAVLIEPDTTNLYTGEYGLSTGAGGNNTLAIADGWFKVTNVDATNGMGVRHYVGLDKLTNGNTYSCSVTVYNPMSTACLVGLDWCDVGGVSYSINPGETRRISTIATRSTYDTTYRFFDVYPNNTGQTIWIKDVQIENRYYPTSYVGSTGGSRPVGKLWYPKELVNLSSFTISCWFNVPFMHTVSTNNTGIMGYWYHPIIELSPASNQSSTGLSICAGPAISPYNRRTNIRFAGSSVNADNYGLTAIQDNTWYHLVITYDGTTYKLYINGNLDLSLASGVSTIYSDTSLMIGGGYIGKPNILIDELRIESRAISTDEVSAWAASGLHYNYLDYSEYVD